MNKNARVRRFIYFIPLMILAFFIIGTIVQQLWNNILVPVIHVGPIGFWQAMGILLLSKILFSSFGGRGSTRMYQKQQLLWEHLTPEQRAAFKKEWRMRNRRWGYRDVEPMAGDPESSET